MDVMKIDIPVNGYATIKEDGYFKIEITKWVDEYVITIYDGNGMVVTRNEMKKEN